MTLFAIELSSFFEYARVQLESLPGAVVRPRIGRAIRYALPGKKRAKRLPPRGATRIENMPVLEVGRKADERLPMLALAERSQRRGLSPVMADFVFSQSGEQSMIATRTAGIAARR